MKQLRLIAKADRRVRLGHAWVFSNEVDVAATPLTAFAAGEIAQLTDARRNPIGLVYVNPRALICARVLARDIRATIDARWFAARIRRALGLREQLFGQSYYRLLYGESDGTPGVVIDRYGEVCVVQLNTAGSLALREPLLEALEEVVAPRGILLRNSGSMRELEGIPALDEALGEVPERIVVREGDMEVVAPLRSGQKTGYFYDQRDNRSRLRRYVRSGDRVLDAYAYVGSWGVSAGLAGASSVTCVDASGLAIEYAVENGVRNGGSIEGVVGDAVAEMERMAQEGRSYDVVVIDPPALIKRRKDQAAGESRYARIHRAALGVLAQGGYLVSSSCSHHLAVERLTRVAYDAARQAGRRFQLLERHAHAPDHPIHPAMPETEYLKTLFTRL